MYILRQGRDNPTFSRMQIRSIYERGDRHGFWKGVAYGSIRRVTYLSVMSVMLTVEFCHYHSLLLSLRDISSSRSPRNMFDERELYSA